MGKEIAIWEAESLYNDPTIREVDFRIKVLVHVTAGFCPTIDDVVLEVTRKKPSVVNIKVLNMRFVGEVQI